MTTGHVTAILLFSVIATATPGPNNLMLLSSGINYGFCRTIPHMAGICIGFTFLLSVVGLGIVQVFETYPLIYQFLKIISVCYLLFLSWKIATATPKNTERGELGSSRHEPLSFLQAASFQWVNPKAWAMGLTAVTAYIPPIDPILGLALVVAIFGLVCVPCLIVWTLLGVQLRHFLNDPVRLRRFNIVTGCLLAGSLYPVFFSSV